jgi:hypothetical protein
MEAACVPYMKMLGMWIYRGIISDPISEVLVIIKFIKFSGGEIYFSNIGLDIGILLFLINEHRKYKVIHE